MTSQTRTRTRTKSRTRRRVPWLWAGLSAVVALALLVALVAGGGAGPAEDTGLAQTRPVTVGGAALPPYQPGADPAVGTPGPELRGASFDGTPVAIARDGRAKLLVFLAHWCPHCRREVPVVVGHLRERPLPANVDLVAIATGTDRGRPNYPPSRWLDREGWSAPVLADSDDGAAATAYGLTSFPYFVALDANGTVVARAGGGLAPAELDRLVARAAG
ncbi:MAG TPA: TlpA disulfide reductase family protein [Frankiaceae bacterium]|nr:TlpA disulfide reductase family protein [Frankiaceae bacterium]